MIIMLKVYILKNKHNSKKQIHHLFRKLSSKIANKMVFFQYYLQNNYQKLEMKLNFKIVFAKFKIL